MLLTNKKNNVSLISFTKIDNSIRMAKSNLCLCNEKTLLAEKIVLNLDLVEQFVIVIVGSVLFFFAMLDKNKMNLSWIVLVGKLINNFSSV